MDWHRRHSIRVFLPALVMIMLAGSCSGVGPGKEVLRGPPMPDRASLRRDLIPGVSKMRDAEALLGLQSVLEYGVIDANGAFHYEPGAKTGPAVRRTWTSHRVYVRGLGLAGQQRSDSREVQMIFGPPDFTLRELIDRDVVGGWEPRTFIQ